MTFPNAQNLSSAKPSLNLQCDANVSLHSASGNMPADLCLHAYQKFVGVAS